jgi:hypothetical protein
VGHGESLQDVLALGLHGEKHTGGDRDHGTSRQLCFPTLDCLRPALHGSDSGSEGSRQRGHVRVTDGQMSQTRVMDNRGG